MFWDYLNNILRLPFLAKSGPLAMLAEGGAAALDAAHDVTVTLRDQFFSTRCESLYLSNFARSRGITRAPLEPVTSYQYRVRFAYLWHKRGGRASALRRLLIDYFGFADIEIVNLRAEDSARWAEFRVICYMVGDQPLFTQAQVTWAINEIKPAGKRLAEVLFVASVIGDVPCWHFGVYSAGVTTVFPAPEDPTILFDEDTGSTLYDEVSGPDTPLKA